MRLSSYFLKCFLPAILCLYSCGESESPEPAIPENSGQISITGITLVDTNGEFDENWEAQIQLTFTNKETQDKYSLTISPREDPIPEKIILPFGSYDYDYTSGNQGEFSATASVKLSGEFTLNRTNQEIEISGTRLNSRIFVSSEESISAPIFNGTEPVTFYSFSSQEHFIYSQTTGLQSFQIPFANDRSLTQYSLLTESSEQVMELDYNVTTNLYEENHIKLDPAKNPISLVGTELAELPSSQNETSGLAWIQGRLFSINDGDNSNQIHELQPLTGELIRSITVANASNRDWEDLAVGDGYLFIGDFGNNLGTRKDLAIYRVPITDVLTSAQVSAERIDFNYPEQSDFSGTDENHPYDCEAMIFHHDKLHLFTKNRGTEDSHHYVLKNEIFVQSAVFIETIETESLISAAEIDATTGEIILLGMKPFGTNPYEQVIWIYELENEKLKSIHPKIKIGDLSLRGNTEGLALGNDKMLWVSSEFVSLQGFPEIAPKLTLFSLLGVTK